jgi:hypothetical protein
VVSAVVRDDEREEGSCEEVRRLDAELRSELAWVFERSFSNVMAPVTASWKVDGAGVMEA